MRNKILLSIFIFFSLTFLLGAEKGCVPETPVSPKETGKLVLLITDVTQSPGVNPGVVYEAASG